MGQDYSSLHLAYPKSKVTNDLSTEALLQFLQDVHLGNLLELVMQGRLENAHVENAFAQRNRRGMRSNKLTDDLVARLCDFGLMQSFFQPKPLHQRRQNLGRCCPAIVRDGFFGETAPFG